MNQLSKPDPARLLQAAKTAVTLFEMAHAAMWALFPDELLALSDESERDLRCLLARALADEHRHSSHE